MCDGRIPFSKRNRAIPLHAPILTPTERIPFLQPASPIDSIVETPPGSLYYQVVSRFDRLQSARCVFFFFFSFFSNFPSPTFESNNKRVWKLNRTRRRPLLFVSLPARAQTFELAKYFSGSLWDPMLPL